MMSCPMNILLGYFWFDIGINFVDLRVVRVGATGVV